MIVLPTADLSGPDDAIKLYIDAGLRPVLIFSPKDGHECWCGKTHEPGPSGSSSSGKHPIARNWQKPNTFDELADQLARLKFTPNVGIVLGEQPGGEYIVAIDVDRHERLEKIVEELGPLPQTVRGESGRGYRLLYELGDEVARGELRNVTGLCGEPGVDVKIKGGQVVVAPSIHHSGRKYTWSRTGKIERLPASWAIALLPKSYEVPDEFRKYTPQTLRENEVVKRRAEKYLERAVISDCNALAQTKEGSRNTLLHKRAVALLALCGGMHLLGRWSWVQSELTRAASAAGLKESEIVRTIQSAEKYVRETGAVRMVPLTTPGLPVAKRPAPENAAPQAEPETPTEITADYTDIRNSEQLIEWYGGILKYVGTWDKWLVWDSRKWNMDDLGGAFESGKRTARRMMAVAKKEHAQAVKQYNEAISEEDDTKRERAQRRRDNAERDMAHATRSQSKARLTSMIEVAKSDPKLAVHHEYLDADRYTFNVQNGTIDLRTGELRKHQQWDLLTKMAPVAYVPDAQCPVWEAFLERAMAGKRELVDFLQRAVGYSLTGSVQEHVLFFCYGNGANGKSTFLNTVHSIVGEYGSPAPRGLLFRAKNERHPTDIATLHGRRYVTCSEVEDGQAFDEALVKDLTGGDRLSARRMREDFWSFEPTHKLFIAGNHRPLVRGDDEGIWRRMRLIPFTVTIPEAERDPMLPHKLREELPGILAWAVRGSMRWGAMGLMAPESVKVATSQYREENDILGQFFRERLVIEANAVIGRAELRAIYELWCKEIGTEPVGARRLASRLRERAGAAGVELAETSKRVGDQVVNAWRGVRLRTSAERT